MKKIKYTLSIEFHMVSTLRKKLLREIVETLKQTLPRLCNPEMRAVERSVRE